MSCKNDSEWEGTYTTIGECVKWPDLITLREKFNELWDILKKEEKADGVKYGYRDAEGTDKGGKEQIEGLADIKGFCSVRFAESGNYDEVYFVITDGEIIPRIDALANGYMYTNVVDNQTANHGPWVVYLKDPCYGCTGFRFQHYDIEYPRGITCNDVDIFNIDPDHWKGQCIWPDCTDPGIVISDWESYCHFNFDWRADPYYRNKFADIADSLFSKVLCAEFGTPCTISRRWCCNEWALAHYTEAYMDHSLCPQNEAAIAAGLPVSEWPYRRRRLRWVSLGVGLSAAQDQPDDTFCCDNVITGGIFSGRVDQKICAIHLQDIWDRIDTMIGGKPLRKCFYNKCKYYQTQQKKDRWIHKEGVPMYATGSTADLMDRKDSCQNCERVNVGSDICACNFNDLNALLDELINALQCTCFGEGEYEGKTLISLGSVTDCDCCRTKCCCNCECQEDLTYAECMKLGTDGKCKYGGPKWLGVYEKGQSQDDSKYGDSKPCGCYEPGDPKYPDNECKKQCGTKAACCSPGPPVDMVTGKVTQPDWKCSCKAPSECNCCCEDLTYCECNARGGNWKGFDGEGGTISCGSICGGSIWTTDCTRECCAGSWILRETGCAGRGSASYGGGRYCEGCYEGLPCEYSFYNYGYQACIVLEVTQCGQTITTGSWSFSNPEGPRTINLQSFCCPSSSGGSGGTGSAVNLAGFLA